MSRRVSRVMRTAFGLLFAAGLTFGASSALAAPRANADCPYAPWNGQFGTSCSVSSECDAYCPNPDGPNVCRSGCCTCFL